MNCLKRPHLVQVRLVLPQNSFFFQMFTAFQMLNCPMADWSLWTCNGLLNGETEGIFLSFSFHSPVVSKTNLYYSQEIGLRKNRGRAKTPPLSGELNMAEA